MSWLLAFVGFALLIILHELGHFAAAKAVGMRVERFSLFFPPTVARKTVGETEYAIGAVPLGGYVKISGMNPAEDLPDEVRTRAYYSQPVWKRVVVIGAGPAVNLVLAFALLFLFISAVGAQDVTTRVGADREELPGLREARARRQADRRRRGPRRPGEALEADPVASLRGQARGRLPGRHAGDAARRARRAPPGVEAHPRLRRGGGADASWVRLLARRAARNPVGGGLPGLDRRPLLVLHQGHGRAAGSDHRSRAAQGHPGGGRRLRDDAPDDPGRLRRRDRDPRDRLPVAWRS